MLVLDEARLYRGANGTEVAYLLRRLMDRLGLTNDQVTTICTSASFSAPVEAAAFATHLTGTSSARMTAIGGTKRAASPSGAGDAELAAVLAAVPLEALQHPDGGAPLCCRRCWRGDRARPRRCG